MDDRRLGMAVRARRHRRGWRQVDLAAAAGVGPGVCGLLERGRANRLSVRMVRTIAAAVDLSLGWDLGWQRQDVDRLLDSDHSDLASLLTRRLEASGWQVRAEVSFNHFGDRGRIDLLAFHPGARLLLVIEIKTAIVDAQDLLGGVDVKARVAPRVARDLGWHPAAVIPMLALASGTSMRRQVARLAPLFGRYDLRGREAFSWLARPSIGPSGLLVYLELPDRNGVDRRRASRRRIRVRPVAPRSQRPPQRPATPAEGA